MRVFSSLGAFLAVCLSYPAPLSADTVTISPSADAGLFEFNSDYNSGGDTTLAAGTLGQDNSGSAGSRCMYRFDIAGAVPTGSTITSVSLSLRVTNSPNNAANSVFAIHPIFQDWGEGTGSGSPQGGRLAVGGEVTWNSRFHGTVTWDEPGGELGGDFAEDPSATQAIAGLGTYLFAFNATGVIDAQAMLDFPGSNFGWMLLSQSEGTQLTARRWTSRENANPPQLEITFTPPDPPATVDPPQILSFEIDRDTHTGIIRFGRKADLIHRLEYKRTLYDPEWTMLDELPPVFQDTEGMFQFAGGVEDAGFWQVVAELPPPT